MGTNCEFSNDPTIFYEIVFQTRPIHITQTQALAPPRPQLLCSTPAPQESPGTNWREAAAGASPIPESDQP
jgi:hypothetical protein